MLVRLTDALTVPEKLSPEAAAVVHNNSHTCTDIYLPMNAQQLNSFDAIDGMRTIAEIARQAELRHAARVLFEGLWWYNQALFDAARVRPGRN